MDAGKAAEYLAQEYLFLEKAVEDFDARALTIKAWSVTFSAAGLGLAYQQNNPKLLLIASGSALVFWLTESVWKYHQRAFYPRLMAIEQWFASRVGARGFAPFQIMTNWRPEIYKRPASERAPRTGWRSAAAISRLRVPFFPGVMLPHVVVFAVGIILYAWAAPDERAARPAPVVAIPAAR
jgi:hypothetical protein